MLLSLMDPLALSPYQQRAAKNLFRGYLFNGYRRLAAQVPYWIVPFAAGACYSGMSYATLLITFI